MMTGNLKPSPETSQPMAIRIQPPEFEISAENPFEHDLLGRAESIKALTTMIGSIEGPCVMAVDASWGMGKTTFLRMWAQHLRNEQFPVVEFNAWETDFAQDPFIALTSEIATGLQNLGSTAGRLGGQRLRSAAASVARTVPGATARVVVSGVPLFGSRLAQELEPKLPSLRQTMVEHYDETKAALQAFRGSLADVAAASANDNDGRALVVLVDELDRCRPTYAVELLEAAKHLFNVDRIVFVLCLDRAQLASSVKALYGESFNADGYLRRFFDLDYRLPNPDRASFVDAVLDSVGVRSAFGDFQQRFRSNDEPAYLYPLVRTFFASSRFSLRQVRQAVHRLGAIVASSTTLTPDATAFLMVLLLLRTCDSDMYRRVVTGDVTDEDAVNALFGHPSLDDARKSNAGTTAEAILISCVLVATLDQEQIVNRARLPLLTQHERHVADSGHVNRDLLTERIVRRVHQCCSVRTEQFDNRKLELATGRHTLNQAVRHLELFPDGLDDAGIS